MIGFSNAKVRFFLIVGVFFNLLSCERDNLKPQVVPDVRFSVSVSELNEVGLQTLLTPVYMQYANGETIGYRGHGIYIIQVSAKEYKAFDASCTFQTNNENHVDIKDHLLPDEQNAVIVKCPQCQSRFNLINGNVQSGIARIGLKEYKTVYSGTVVRVFN